jgi:thioredoxin-like negative regulator of GroEL
MIEINNKHDLTEQLSLNKRVIALFCASWCPFCRSFLPAFSAAAKKEDSTVFLRVRVDDDDNPLWEEYSLEAVPAVVFFEKGEVRRRLDCQLGVGLNEKQLNEWLNRP